MAAAIAAIAVACAFVTPAVAQANPPQAGNDYEQAVTARRTGEAGKAVGLLDRWLTAHPADADALVQRGYAHLELGHHSKAAADFRAALAIAPGYADARTGLTSATTARHADSAGGYLLVEGALSTLSNGASDWHEAAIDGAITASPGASIGARASWYRRFGVEDVELVGRVALHPRDNLWLRASAGGTPGADFRPEIETALGIDYRVASGSAATVLTIDGSYQRFPLQAVISINPGVIQYLPGGRSWLTVRGIATVADSDPIQLGALARIDYAPRDDQRYFVGIANGPETDLGIVTRVTSLFGGAQFPLGHGFSLAPSVAHEWREGGSERTEFRVGLKTAF